MRGKIIFILIASVSISYCATDAKIEAIKNEPGYCVKPNFGSFTYGEFLEAVLDGSWSYSHSYTRDTCVVLQELVDVPLSMEFKIATDTPLVSIIPGIKFPENNIFKNIHVTITDDKGFKHSTGIFTTMHLAPDSLIRNLLILHRSLADDHLKYECKYNVNGIRGDTMYVSSGHYHGISDNNPLALKHLFIRHR
jgi:hypothetical protein